MNTGRLLTVVAVTLTLPTPLMFDRLFSAVCTCVAVDVTRSGPVVAVTTVPVASGPVKLRVKVSVKGSDMNPLYGYLTSQTGGDVKWNFTKFLVDKDGKIVQRFESKVTPESSEMTGAIEQALAK